MVKIVTMSIYMYISNLSSRKMRNQLGRHFIENHSTTDEVPSERAGVNLELGENRWLDLIKLATINN